MPFVKLKPDQGESRWITGLVLRQRRDLPSKQTQERWAVLDSMREGNQVFAMGLARSVEIMHNMLEFNLL
jgi:hypothetical protein